MSVSNEQLLKSIRHYQESLDKYTLNKNDYKLLDTIKKLKRLPISTSHLENTGIGRTVNGLRKLGGEVGDAAKGLVARWKEMVLEEEEKAKEESQEEPVNTSCSTDNDVDNYESTEELLHDIKESKSSHTSRDIEKKSNDKHRKDIEKHTNNSKKSSDKKERHRDSDSSSKKRKPEYRSDSEEHHSKKRSVSSSSESEEDVYEEKRRKSSSHRRRRSSSEEEDEKHKSKKSKHHSHDSSSEEREHGTKSSHSSKSHRSSSKSKSSEKTDSKKHDHDSHSRDEKSKSKHKSDRSKRDSDCEESKSSSKHKRDSKSELEETKVKNKHESKSRHEKDSSKDSKSKESKSHSSRSEKSEKRDKKDSKSSGSKEFQSPKKDDVKKHEDKSKDRKSDKKEKSSSKSEESSKSSNNTLKQKSSSERKKETEKVKLVDSEKMKNGIDSGSGASFADALGMCEPVRSSKTPLVKKKKSSNSTVTSEKPKASSSYAKPEKYNDYDEDDDDDEDNVPSLLKQEPEPLNLNISSLLPEITPNYRPLGLPLESQPRRILTPDEALSQAISNKNMRTKVYSGNKSYGKLESLFDLCVRVLQDNIDALEYTGGVPYLILKPVLERATPDQLFNMEHHNPYLIEDTDELWHLHCQKEFRTKKREELESWREMYMRCLDEREARLNAITANIKQSQDKSIPVRTTKLAYVDSVVKPPRNIARKQAKNGIIADKRPSQTPASRLSALATAGEAGKVAVPNPGSRAVDRSSSSSSNSAALKPKKAPLMMKSLSLFKNRFRK